MFNVTDSQKKVLTLWGIIAIIILLIVILFATISFQKEKTPKENNIADSSSKKVIDRNRYYTVKNAITKYYSYLNMKDYASALIILEDKYKSDNDITESNLEKFITNTQVNIAYQTKVMCLTNVVDGAYTFVVNGEEISANKGNEIAKKYYEITLDGKTLHFNLKPITESSYNEVCHG